MLTACVCLLVAPWCFAGKADDNAKKTLREAMEEDYLATNMSTAVAKLRSALAVCQKSTCSKDTHAALQGALGIVYAAGLNAHEDAVAAFKKMLEADPKSVPQAAYMTVDVQADFDRARAETKGAANPTPAPPSNVAVLKEKPWTEQATYHPVPVFVSAPEDVKVSRVVVRYKAPGDSDWRELPINKHKAGFGGLIPCAAVERPGALVYYVTAFDSNLDRVASAGSAEEPRKVELKAAISGRQPSLPGNVPPEECPRPVQGLSCETNDDCPGDKVCHELACVDESSLEKPKSDEPVDNTPRKHNWLSLSFSPDLTVVTSESDACSAKAQQGGKLACFFKGDVQYNGSPLTGNGNSLKGGVGLGSMRVLVGYERLIGTRLTLGTRLGFAFSGTPKRAGGKTFLPLHAEARGAYWLGKDPFAKAGVRAYVLLNGGVSQASARLTTEVVEDDGTGNRSTRKLDVYKTSGPFFGGAGLGVQYAVSPEAAMVIEVAGRAMVPDFAPVIAPSLGFAYGI
ncbi:MAG: hypothetical protein IPI67_38350 [Myxococcales bacterium]|nr:hypothetical protein [Myxococcales bacterium]